MPGGPHLAHAFHELRIAIVLHWHTCRSCFRDRGGRRASGYRISRAALEAPESNRDVATCLFDALALMNNANSAPAAQSDRGVAVDIVRRRISQIVIELDTCTKKSVTTEEIEQDEAFRRKTSRNRSCS